jgi:hypothetical protein
MIDDKIISLIALIVSGISFLVSLFFSVLSLRSQTLSDKIALLNTREQYFEHMKSWADEVVITFQEAIHLASIDPKQPRVDKEFFYLRHEIKIKFASLIDKGRWIFPNLEVESKEISTDRFTGYRNEILNSVTWGYKLVSGYDYREQKPNWKQREMLLEQERLFIDQIKELLNPDDRVKEYYLLIGKKK